MTLPALRSSAKRLILRLLPLSVRKRLSVFVGRQEWLRGRYWYSMELLRDLAEDRPSEFHRFLWENHIAYAETYEVGHRFGEEKLHPSRRMLFSDLLRVLRRRGVDPASDVRSVFEVGSSMGYLLRHMEVSVFPSARTLEGVDIDAYAVRLGSEHLRRLGSKVRIRRGDMENLEEVLDGRRYDLVLCAGVLMYLPREGARSVVRTLLKHTDGLLVLTGPAYPASDNRSMERSIPRGGDQAFIHNLDAMVEAAGGEIVFRRWEGERIVEGNSIYFVFAVPTRSSGEPGGSRR